MTASGTRPVQLPYRPDVGSTPDVRPRLVGVFAHPDDEAWSIGGTLALHAGRVDVTIVLCTSGGNGPIWEPVATRESLARVREAEEARWCQAIGLHDARVEFLRYTDWHLPEVPFEELVGRVEGILRRDQPHVVVTFGPDGLTGHHDHVRAGEAAAKAFDRARRATIEDPGTFARLYQVALRHSTMARFYGAVRDRGLPLGGEDDPLNPRGIPDELIAVDIDVEPVYERKVEAIRMHRSQVGELDRIPRDLQPLMLSRECLVQAWPPWTRGAVSQDLFEGLPVAG